MPSWGPCSVCYNSQLPVSNVWSQQGISLVSVEAWSCPSNYVTVTGEKSESTWMEVLQAHWRKSTTERQCIGIVISTEPFPKHRHECLPMKEKMMPVPLQTAMANSFWSSDVNRLAELPPNISSITLASYLLRLLAREILPFTAILTFLFEMRKVHSQMPPSLILEWTCTGFRWHDDQARQRPATHLYQHTRKSMGHL